MLLQDSQGRSQNFAEISILNCPLEIQKELPINITMLPRQVLDMLTNEILHSALWIHIPAKQIDKGGIFELCVLLEKML